MERMIEQLEQEIINLGKMGLSTSNIDRAYKLIDMYDNMRDAMYKKTKENMMMHGEGEVIGAKAGAKKSPVADNLYDEYIKAKKDYRYDQTSECKRKLMNSLDEYMESFAKHLETMMNDAECTDERDTIHRYINKIRNL